MCGPLSARRAAPPRACVVTMGTVWVVHAPRSARTSRAYTLRPRRPALGPARQGRVRRQGGCVDRSMVAPPCGVAPAAARPATALPASGRRLDLRLG